MKLLQELHCDSFDEFDKIIENRFDPQQRMIKSLASKLATSFETCSSIVLAPAPGLV
jgi:hypothetical protein